MYPVVNIALNMMDYRQEGDVIDVKKSSKELGVTAVEIAAIKGEGN